MSTRFGFFKEHIQRDTGSPSVGTVIDITGTAVNANAMVFSIDSNLTTEATLKYQFVGLSNSDIAESVTGTVNLDSEGNANVTITLIPDYDVSTNTSFTMNVTSVNDFALGSSDSRRIITVNDIDYVYSSSGQYTANDGNIVLKMFSNGNITVKPRIDPWTGVFRGEKPIRITAVGGGGSGANDFALGAGGGGGVADVVLDTSDITSQTNFPVTIGAQSIRPNLNDTIRRDGGNTSLFNIIAYGGEGGISGGGSESGGRSGNISVANVITVGNPGGDVFSDASGQAGGGGGSFINSGETGRKTVEASPRLRGGNGAVGVSFIHLDGPVVNNVVLGSGGGGGTRRTSSINLLRGLGGDYAGNGSTQAGSTTILGFLEAEDAERDLLAGLSYGAGGGGGLSQYGPPYQGTRGSQGIAFLSYQPNTNVYRVFEPTS